MYSAYIQDEIWLIKDKVSATAGSKFERNNYTGLEVQPSVRLLWKPSETHTVWSAVTRAVRTPARTDEDVDLTIFVQPGLYAAVVGNRSLRAEQLIGYEAGYRAVLNPKLGFDTAVFHNDYDDLVDVGGGALSVETLPIPHALLTLRWANGMKATTNGFELAPDFRPLAWWRVKPSYSFIRFDASNKPGNTDVNAVAALKASTPEHLMFVQSFIDLPRRLEFDQAVRYVSELPAQQVAAYTTADARLSWHFNDQLEVALVGQNLFQPHHAEFGRDLPPIVGIRRNGYISVRWQR